MIIALPETGHNHLADALVRDLGFTRTHVDAPLRELLLALDPFVDSGVTLANMGPSPRLSSKLEQVGGGTDEDRWDRLLNPPRPGSAPDRNAAEVRRLLDVLRSHDLVAEPEYEGDVVIVGVADWRFVDGRADWRWVVIDGRCDGNEDTADQIITPAGVVGEQEAIVAYVKQLREPKVAPVVPADVDGLEEAGEQLKGILDAAAKEAYAEIRGDGPMKPFKGFDGLNEALADLSAAQDAADA